MFQCVPQAVLCVKLWLSVCCRAGADEVHVSVGRPDAPLVSCSDEAGAFPGGGAGEQQCGRTQGKGEIHVAGHVPF